MSHTLTIEQASSQLVGLVRALGPDDEIILTDNNRAVARILPSTPRASRVAGSCKDLLTIISEDDDHLDDFKDYMP